LDTVEVSKIGSNTPRPVVLDYTNIKPFLDCFVINCFPRTNPASEEQYRSDPTPLKYTGVVISTAEEFYSFTVFISELEKNIA